jgi:nucleoside-diphosphate-sugar epimerase
MAGFCMMQRILVLGVECIVGAKVQAALSASEWATPVPFTGPPGTLTNKHLGGIQAVFNGTMGSPDAILATAKALCSALELNRSDVRVVHLSSMTVYGSHTGEAAESMPLRSVGAYGAAQVDAESLVRRHPRSVVLRPGCEYGPHCPAWSERIARLLCSHRLGDLGAHGDGVCNLIFIDDLVAASVKSLRLSGIDGQCFNLAMRSPPTWNEYLALFARTLGAVPVSRIGARRLKIETRLLAPPLKILDLVAQRLPGRPHAVPPAITPSLLNLCAQNVTLNSRKAEQVLDLAWTPLAEGLRQAAAWFKGSYSIGNISMRRNSIG